MSQMMLNLNLKKLFLVFTVVFYTLNAWADTQIKPTWYRYYDHRGVVNISSYVTPDHIKYGYQALDASMQVLESVKPFNAQKNVTQNSKVSHANQQKDEDQRLKQAYGSSQLATQKRQESLLHLNKQIKLQTEQLSQFKKDRELLLQKERTYLSQKATPPAHLTNSLNYNRQYILLSHKQLQRLQTQYQQTKTEYDRIIARLKTLE